MDILHDKRMVKSFMASLAINAVGVCLIGGGHVYNVRQETVQSPDSAATLHPVPITVATIPLTDLSTTNPGSKHQDSQNAEKRPVNPAQQLGSTLVRKVKVKVTDRRKLKVSKLVAKPKAAKHPAGSPQMALATPQDFQGSGKSGPADSRKAERSEQGGQPDKSGLRGDVNDKLFEQTLTGLEHDAGNAQDLRENSTQKQGKPGDTAASRGGAGASQLAARSTSSGVGKMSEHANGGRPGDDHGKSRQEQGQTQSSDGSQSGGQHEAKVTADGHDDAKPSDHHGRGTATAKSAHAGKAGTPAHDVYGPKGSQIVSRKPAGPPPTPARSHLNESKHTVGTDAGGAPHDRYIGQTYKGASPVNEQIHQAAALDPGNDPGTAVHALHLPKASDYTMKGQPGPKRTIGSVHSNPDKDDKSGFEIVPTDLGSTSLFGQVPWGKPVPSNYQDPNAGKDGMGLLGSYYVGRDFDQLEFQRADNNINFIWTFTGPGPLMPPRQPFCVRWTGELVAPYTEPYTIMTASDDGVRVYLNGDLIIDNWTVHAVTEDTATVNLVANQPNDIRVEYFEKNGMSNEIIKLYWESKDTPLEYIPENALIYPATN